MRVRRLIARWGILLASLGLTMTLSLPVFAASSISRPGDGLKISPVTNNVVINPGQNQTVPVSVQNVTNSTIELQVIVNDFVAGNDENGTPSLLLDPGQYAPSHSLKRFVAPISNFTLAPGEQKTVDVVVAIPKGTPGGGYYGAVRFAPVANSGSSNVTLSASVGSLILVRVPGTYREDMNLVSLDVRNGSKGEPQFIFTGSDNLYVAARFQNSGDVQEQPFGKVLLKQGDMQLGTYEINSTNPRGNVLPGSIRKFTVKLTNVGIFGQYTVIGSFGYGNNGQLLSGQTTFYVIPLAAIIVVLVVVALVLFGIFGLPKMVARYNEGVIRRASRR